MLMASQIFAFPAVVNEKAARTVAAVVATAGVVILATGWHWLTALLAVGFLLRVLGGPRFSPLGRLASQVIAPKLGPSIPTAGPPKRFAQGVGLAVTSIAAISALGFGLTNLATALIAVLVVFALLESVLGWCAGCYVFAKLMAWGLIPEETCEACANINLARV